jgi:hypothetical protein
MVRNWVSHGCLAPGRAARIFARKIAYRLQAFNYRVTCTLTKRIDRATSLRMQPAFRSALVALSRRVLYPLVRILVRFGVSAGELKSIVDSAYAHAGSQYLRERGERVTYSRLAVITGINRSFLPALLAKPQDQFQPRSDTQLHRAARVLAGWHEDVRFQTSRGLPAVLAIRGGRQSFERLVHAYSGGVYYANVLSELVEAGAVKQIGSDRVRALRRSLAVAGANVDYLQTAAQVSGDLLSTLEHNLTSPANEQLPVRSLVVRADPRILPLFRARVAKRSDALLESLEGFLQAHAPKGKSRGEAEGANGRTLGTTVFAICRPLRDEAAAERPSRRPGRPPKSRPS